MRADRIEQEILHPLHMIYYTDTHVHCGQCKRKAMLKKASAHINFFKENYQLECPDFFDTPMKLSMAKAYWLVEK